MLQVEAHQRVASVSATAGRRQNERLRPHAQTSNGRGQPSALTLFKPRLEHQQVFGQVPRGVRYSMFIAGMG